MDIASLEDEARRLILTAFTEDTALRLGGLLVDLARADRAPVVIDIRTPDRTLFHAALPGTSSVNDLWAWRKSNVAFRFHAASMLVRLRMQAKGDTLAENGLDTAQHAIHGGAVPVVVQGVGMVACATVSGLPQEADHAMVARALAQLQAQ